MTGLGLGEVGWGQVIDLDLRVAAVLVTAALLALGGYWIYRRRRS